MNKKDIKTLDFFIKQISTIIDELVTIQDTKQTMLDKQVVTNYDLMADIEILNDASLHLSHSIVSLKKAKEILEI